MPELANGLAWKARVVKHICDRDAVAPPFDVVFGRVVRRLVVTEEIAGAEPARQPNFNMDE